MPHHCGVLLQNKLCFFCFFRTEVSRATVGRGAGEGAVAVMHWLPLMCSLTAQLLGAGGPGLGERLGRISVCFQNDFSVVQMGFVHKCGRKKHSLFRWSDGAV